MKHQLTFIFFTLCIISSSCAQNKVVILDSYYNNEYKKDSSGNLISFHYKWEDTTNVGYSILGNLFKKQGAVLETLSEAPSSSNLKGSAIYIIVDPDNQKESQKPNYVTKDDVDVISNWVNSGGVLMMLANDSANTELTHFNQLAARFNMHFNNDMISHVIDDQHFQDGSIDVRNHPVFKTSHKIFMKDACSISIEKPAYALLKQKNDVIIAATRYGKGTVVAIGDPWLYNEYVNGRLPSEFDNDKAAEDLIKWLLEKTGAQKDKL